MFRFQLFNVYSSLVVALVVHSASMTATAQQAVFKVQVVADEMCCNGCAQKVAAQLYALPGVTSVEADVPNRLLTVTAKPSPKLTLDRIWYAVEQGKGDPSKIVTSQVTYALTRPESLKPEQRLPSGQYSLELRSIQDKDFAQKVANQVYAIRGVKNVSVDVAQRTLFVQSANGAVLSPWALATAVERAQGVPVSVSGPYGVLTIERPADSERTADAHTNHPQFEGDVR